MPQWANGLNIETMHESFHTNMKAILYLKGYVGTRSAIAFVILGTDK